MTITLNTPPTIWASDTNFSSGPNIGTPTRSNPGSGYFAQGFIPGDTIPGQFVNFVLGGMSDYLTHLRTQLIVAIDGTNGGTYVLTDQLIFDGGSAVRFVDQDLEILSGARIVVSDAGEISMGDSEDLTIDDSTDVFRLSLGSAVALLSGGAATWKPEPRGAGWRQVDVSGGFDVSFPLPLPVGDTITNIKVVVNGGVGAGHGGAIPSGTDRLRVLLVSVDTAGVATIVASKRDPSASVGAYDASHVITLDSGSLDSGTLPHLVDDDAVYYVVVEGEAGANAVANTTVVTSIFGDVIARSYRSSLMVY